MKNIVAVDIGTTAFKALVINEDGKILASDTLEYTIESPNPGWAEVPVDRYVDAFRSVYASVLRKAHLTAEEIDTMGISCQGETSVFLDENDQPVYPAIVWMDTRASEEAESIVEEFGIDLIQKNTGQICADAIWPGAKLLWMRKHHPEIFARMRKIVQLNGYIAYILTGRLAEDDSLLGSSVYWNINTRSYWKEMMDYIGLQEEMLPEVVYPGSNIGKVTKDASLRYGVSQHTMINIGGMDFSLGAIGSGNYKPGIFSESTGSSLCTVALSDHPVLDPSRQMLCYCSAIRGMYMIHAYSTGGMVVRWFRDNFCKMELEIAKSIGVNAYDQMDAMTEDIPAGCEGLIALPHLQGSGPPDMNPKASAVFYGVNISHTKAHFIKAIYESMAIILRRIVNVTREMGVEIDHVVSYGGGALSEVWLQIKADTLGIPISTTANNESEGCLGAAILAGTACGIWDGIEDAAKTLIKPGRTYIPNEQNREAYDALYEKYMLLMKCLEPTFQ